MAKTATAPSIFDDEVLEATRAGIAEPNRRGWKAKFGRIYVWVAIFTTPFLALGVAVLAVGNSGTPTAAQQTASTATSSAGRTTATQAMQQWLASKPSPLPGGQIMSWDGAKVLAPPAVPKGAGVPVTFKTEVDSFTVIDGRSNTYAASVQVALDPRGGGAQAIGGPSLVPTIPAANDQWASGGPWPGLNASTDANTSVQTAVTGWSQAYTSGSADSLRLAVGDQAANHIYLPLTGVDSAAATVTYLAPYGAVGTEIAQVTLDLRWHGQKVDPNASKSTDVPLTTMDLLIERANTAAPVVTAWGAPGSGPTLTDYCNAVSAPAVAAPSASPTNTP